MRGGVVKCTLGARVDNNNCSVRFFFFFSLFFIHFSHGSLILLRAQMSGGLFFLHECPTARGLVLAVSAELLAEVEEAGILPTAPAPTPPGGAS